MAFWGSDDAAQYRTEFVGTTRLGSGPSQFAFGDDDTHRDSPRAFLKQPMDIAEVQPAIHGEIQDAPVTPKKFLSDVEQTSLIDHVHHCFSQQTSTGSNDMFGTAPAQFVKAPHPSQKVIEIGRAHV